MTFWRGTTGGTLIDARVIPRSSRSEIIGEHNGALKIKLKSPPSDGAANAELVKLLSKTLKIAVSEIEIRYGAQSKLKTILLKNLTADEIGKRLNLT